MVEVPTLENNKIITKLKKQNKKINKKDEIIDGIKYGREIVLNSLNGFAPSKIALSISFLGTRFQLSVINLIASGKL